MSVRGCGGLVPPARVRQIGRRVYSGSGLFFFNQQAIAKRNRWMREERERELEREGEVGEWG